VRAGHHTVSYWSTYGSDDSLAGYQATAATTEELTADCCDRQRLSRHRNRVEYGRAARATRTSRRDVELIVTN